MPGIGRTAGRQHTAKPGVIAEYSLDDDTSFELVLPSAEKAEQIKTMLNDTYLKGQVKGQWDVIKKLNSFINTTLKSGV